MEILFNSPATLRRIPAAFRELAVFLASFLLIFPLILPTVGAEQAAQPEGPLTCIVCGKTPLAGKVAMHKLGAVCEECHALTTRCAHCGLPVKEGYTKTSDGRLFCQRDQPNLVFSTNEAQTVFSEAMAAVLKMSSNGMVLRQPKIEVSLTDVDDWNANGTAGDMRRNGFSKSRKVGQDFSHIVSLLSGQARSDMRGVCAHEYTHLWINESVTGQRTIDPDTVEAICELVAYKLAQTDGDTNQMGQILVNPYTHGMITNLVAFEAKNGLEQVLAWVKQGAGDKISLDGLSFESSPTPVVRTEFPSDITLTGVMGSTSRRLAMISGIMVKKGERRRIQMKDRAVFVRCLEINEESVVVQVTGEKSPRTLTLDAR